MKRSTRVLWVLDHADSVLGSFGGLLEILRHLDRSCFEPFAVVPGPGGTARAMEALGVPVLQRPVVPSGRNLRYARAVWSFRRLLARQRIGLLYLADHTRWRPAELLAARWARIPAVVHLRTPPDHGLVADPSLRRAQAIIGNSAATLRPLRRAVPDGVLHVVYDSIDFEPFGPGPDRRDEFFARGTPIVGFVGIFRPEKGVEDFLEMARILRTVRPDVRYLAVGGDSPSSARGWLAQMQERAAALGVADVVRFSGARTDIPEIMRSLDVLVVPSLTEGFGRVIVEANAVGTPVVGTEVGGIPEVIEDGTTGLLVAARRPAAMAAAVQRVLDDAPWRTLVAARAPARVRARFAPAMQVGAIEAIWRQVLSA
jgi:glycosyltransferase involved in cell wall biosynthesis